MFNKLESLLLKFMPFFSWAFEHRTKKTRQIILNILKFFRNDFYKTEIKSQKIINNNISIPYFEVDKNIGIKKINLDKKLVNECVIDTENRFKNFDLNINTKGKTYLKKITQLEDYDKNSAVFKLATHPKLISSVSNYLGRAPILFNIQALYSSQQINNELSGSQFWHTDSSDLIGLKIWILCSNVGALDGPTICLGKSESDFISKKYFHKHGSKFKNDDIFDKYKDSVVKILGKKGTSFATDTYNCFHMGSRTKSRNGRLVLMINYVTRDSIYFWPCFRKLVSRKLNKNIKNLSNYQKQLLFPISLGL